MTDILDDLQWRGLIAQTTDRGGAARGTRRRGRSRYYCGFDPTAPSLHVGNLVQLLRCGASSTPATGRLALVGGATGLIGDPRPTSERTLNTEETSPPGSSASRSRSSRSSTSTGDNAARAWSTTSTGPRRCRRSTSCATSASTSAVNQMLAKDAVSARLRLRAGISYTEFSYQLLQALDFLELYRRHGCTLQIGGSDQWGNITAGRRPHPPGRGRAACTRSPRRCSTEADGTKFGKRGRRRLARPELTSPYAFYQFWLNTDDARRRRATSRYFTFRAPRGDRGARGGGRRAAAGADGAARARRGAHRAGARRAERDAVVAAASRRCSAGASSADSTPATLRRRWPRPAGRRRREPGELAAGRSTCCVADRAGDQQGAARRRSPRAGRTSTTSAGRPTPRPRRGGGPAARAAWLVLRRGKRNVAGGRGVRRSSSAQRGLTAGRICVVARGAAVMFSTSARQGVTDTADSVAVPGSARSRDTRQPRRSGSRWSSRAARGERGSRFDSRTSR